MDVSTDKKTDAAPSGSAAAGSQSASGPSSNSAGITLTPKAAAEVKKIIAENGLPAGTCLRVGAKGGGCSGFSYVLDFDQRGKTDFDHEYVWHGVRVLIDKKSQLVMKDTVIDFTDENLLNRGFVFQNPTASGSCGCGTSFSV